MQGVRKKPGLCGLGRERGKDEQRAEIDFDEKTQEIERIHSCEKSALGGPLDGLRPQGGKKNKGRKNSPTTDIREQKRGL